MMKNIKNFRLWQPADSFICAPAGNAMNILFLNRYHGAHLYGIER